MAGLGFKDFQVGEVLTSSDVDGYLMQQTVMRFADSGARGSALGTAPGTAVALAEGMVSYLDDANRIEIYDGTEWRIGNLPFGTAAPVDGSVLQYGTAAAEYAPTAGPFFSAVAAGTADVTVGATSTNSVSVTLPASRFSSVPIVTATAFGAVAQNASSWLGSTISASGFTVNVRNNDGSVRAFTVQWMAVSF